MKNVRRRIVVAGPALFGLVTLMLLLSGLVACEKSTREEKVAETEESLEEMGEEIEDGFDRMSEEVETEVEALRIKGSLLDELGRDAMGIEVEIEGVKAVLTGEVESEQTQELATEVALASGRVAEVDNHVRIAAATGAETEAEAETETETETEIEADEDATSFGERVADAGDGLQDALLETRVKTKLLTELGQTGFDIEVEASGGGVSLRGIVADEFQRDTALAAARGTDGVVDVIDLIEIRGS